MPNCPAFVESLFGASLLGAVPVLINARYRTEELAYVTANAVLRVILTTDLIADRVDFAALLAAALPGSLRRRGPGGAGAARDPVAARVRPARRDEGARLPRPRRLRPGRGRRARGGDRRRGRRGRDPRRRDPDVHLGHERPPEGLPAQSRGRRPHGGRDGRALRLTSDDVWWCPLPLCHMSGVLPLAATLLADSRFACMTDFEPGGPRSASSSRSGRRSTSASSRR